MVKLPPHVIAISKAKSAAQLCMPYVGAYLESVPTVFDERVPTMAVDSVGRLYINPEWCLQWSHDQNGYVLLHEMMHNLLGHGERRATFLTNPTPEQLKTWNVAADLCVQQILEQHDVHRPANSVAIKDYLHIPGLTRGMATEKYFSILNQHQQQQPSPNPTNGGGQGKPDEDDDGDDGQPDDSGNDPDGETEEGKPVNGKPKNQEHNDSGSASDGIKRDYELEDDLSSVGANIQRLEEIRQELEKDPNVAKGSGKGIVKQALNIRLRRQPDPFDQLKALVGRYTAAPIGMEEPTYRRRNRRQEDDDLPLKGVIRLNPECVIIIDTSGSMGCPDVSDRAARAMTAISQGLRRVHRPRVIAWDGDLQSDALISSMKQFTWEGGGGTSMDEAVVMADKKYQPDAIVLVTDCGTDWPAKQTRARLIVAMVAKDTTPPKWARTVDLTKEVNVHVG